ncbi:unnamed protein product, partial [Arabidopsis halleri]
GLIGSPASTLLAVASGRLRLLAVGTNHRNRSVPLQTARNR